MTLSQHVDNLACRAIRLSGLASEMLATIQLNVERGYLVAVNDEGKLNLNQIVASWKRQLDQLDMEEKQGNEVFALVDGKVFHCQGVGRNLRYISG